MDLLENPFYVLTATQQDNRQRIMELAEERSLLWDINKCMEARAILTHPRKRISAEMAWLPGVHLKRVNEMLLLLESSTGNFVSEYQQMSRVQEDSLAAVLSRLPYTGRYNIADEVLELLKSSDENPIVRDKQDKLTEIRNLLGIDKLEPIARANLLAARMHRLPNFPSDEVVKWILEIARTFESINAEDVRATLNAERRESGFPEITNLSAITEEIRNRRHYYQQIVRSTLENLSTKERLRTIISVTEPTSCNSEDYWPIMIEDSVDAYEVVTSQFLDAMEENIEVLNQKIRVEVDREIPDVTFTPLVNQFIQSVKDWDTIAQPIQVSKKRQGLTHEASLRVARRARQLAIHLFNEYDKLYFSQQLINMLEEAFAEVPEVVEQLAEDAKALDKIAEQYHSAEIVEKLENIKAQAKELRNVTDAKNPDYILASRVKELVHAVKKWDASTQPIEVDYTVITLVGDLALHLLNAHNKPDFASQLIEVIREVFAEALEIADLQ